MDISNLIQLVSVLCLSSLGIGITLVLLHVLKALQIIGAGLGRQQELFAATLHREQYPEGWEQQTEVKYPEDADYYEQEQRDESEGPYAEETSMDSVLEAFGVNPPARDGSDSR